MATEINLTTLLNDNHSEFFQSIDREVLFYGGKGSGKSFSAVDKILIQPGIQGKKIKTVVIRKTMPSLKRTCVELFDIRSQSLQIPYTLNRTDFIARTLNDSQIIFVSLDDKDAHRKLQSITDVDFIYFEEVNEITEKDYETAILTLRGGNSDYKQAFALFNPISRLSWVYERFWIRDINKIKKIHVTVHSNPYIDTEYIDALKRLEFTNYNLYKVYYLGEWGQLEGTIYDNYQVIDFAPSKIDEIIYGLDFGFNNPSALIKIYISDQVLYLEELIYKTKLTNTDLIQEIKRCKINPSDVIYCDNAEPDRIKEICMAGFNAKPCDKKTNIKYQIDFIKTKQLKILSDSVNLIKEIQGYSWKQDKDGRALDEPVKFEDHGMDSARYAIFSHLAKPHFEFTAYQEISAVI